MSCAVPALASKACAGCKERDECIDSNRRTYHKHLADLKTKYEGKPSETEQLRQTVASLQAKLKEKEKRVEKQFEQFAGAGNLMAQMFKKNAEYLHDARAAKKKAAYAQKQLARWKLLARRRKNALLESKKKNIALSDQLKRRASNKRSGDAESSRHSTPTLQAANAMDAAAVERPNTNKTRLKKAVARTVVQRCVQLANFKKKATVTLEELREHVENASSFWADDKMKCPICTSHLMRHLMTHAASIYHPYKCPSTECDMKFIRAQNVKLHFANHGQSWTDEMEEQMRHEENLRRFEEFRELAAESALKSQEDH